MGPADFSTMRHEDLEQECERVSFGVDGARLGTEWVNLSRGDTQCSYGLRSSSSFLWCALKAKHQHGHRTSYIGAQPAQSRWERLLRPTENEMSDWTVSAETRRCNESAKFLELQKAIAEIIRNSGHDLINGRVEMVAGIILATLAHKHSMRPVEMETERLESLGHATGP